MIHVRHAVYLVGAESFMSSHASQFGVDLLFGREHCRQ